MTLATVPRPLEQHSYSWPSSGALKDYKYDFDSARFAVEHLEAFLKIVASRYGATNVHVIAHSMGNWPILAVLDRGRKEPLQARQRSKDRSDHPGGARHRRC